MDITNYSMDDVRDKSEKKVFAKGRIEEKQKYDCAVEDDKKQLKKTSIQTMCGLLSMAFYKISK